MVKLSSSTPLPNRKIEVKGMLVEEKSTKPPGTARFNRTRVEVRNESYLSTKDDIITVAELCRKLLENGFVQSYVDFYHLTHRLDPNTPEHRGTENQIKTSPEDMIFIRDQLLKAELSRRQGDTTCVYEAFNKLADFYIALHDWKTSFFFHEKCLEVAQLTNDSRGEMSANHSMGVIYQLMTNFEGAKAFHERHEEIATNIDVLEEIAKANVELYKVYLILAEKAESDGNNEEALNLYFKCLSAAKKSWDRSCEGEANGKIGNLLLSGGDAQQSLQYLREQAQISADLGHAEGRCRACSALALALDTLGQSDRALAELMLVNTIAEQAGDSYLQAQVSRSLGTLYSKMGKLESAVDMFQRHFNLIKAILYRSSSGADKNKKDPNAMLVTSKDMDLARSYIGISKGNLVMGSYVMSIQCDLSSLLDWKMNRSELPKITALMSRMNDMNRNAISQESNQNSMELEIPSLVLKGETELKQLDEGSLALSE